LKINAANQTIFKLNHSFGQFAKMAVILHIAGEHARAFVPKQLI